MQGEIVEDLSSPYSTNRVYLFQSKRHGRIIKKEFEHFSHFKRAVEAMKAVDRSLHPAVYKIDMRRRHLYMSYDPIETLPASMDACVADLMKNLHSSTKRYGGVSDPGTGRAFASWKDYLQKKGPEWLEILKDVKDVREKFEERLNVLDDAPFAPVAYIHRDIRPEHVGERKGHYILLDFEHAIVGDPYWDVARYALQSAQSNEGLYHLYGVEDPDRADLYVWMCALAFAADLVRHGRTADTDIEKCITVLERD